MGHFQFFLHLKIKLRFCVFSSWLHLLLFHCYSCQTHFWNHEQQWETWNFKFSCWYLWSYCRCCGKSWKQSHTKLFEKNVTRMATGGCFPWPSIECFSHCIRFHSLCLFVCLFLYWNGAFLHKQEGKHRKVVYLDHRMAASVRINWNDGNDPTPELDCETNPSTATANVMEGRWFYFQCF